MRRLRCECGQFAPMRSLRRAVQAKHDLGKKVVQPPWQKGAGSFSEIARQKAPRRKGPKTTQHSSETMPLADSDVPSSTGAPSADWIAKFCPQGLQEQLKTLASEEVAQQQEPQAKQKKPPANQVEAERSLTKAQRQFTAAEKRCEEVKEQVRKGQEELVLLEQEQVRRQEAVEQATARLNELCAKKLALSENVLVPTPACLADENYRAKFEELRALQAGFAKKEKDAAAQAAEEAGLFGQDVPVEMDTADDAALQESAQEVLEKLPEGERGGAKRLLDDFLEVQAKKAKGTPAFTPPPVVGAGSGV